MSPIGALAISIICLTISVLGLWLEVYRIKKDIKKLKNYDVKFTTNVKSKYNKLADEIIEDYYKEG